MTDLEQTLQRYWGYSQFRSRQQEIVGALLAGRDAAVVMPTGGGKSLCYQLPAVVAAKTCVVISPLISLMDDQAQQLNARGIPAACLHSNISFEEQKEIWRRLLRGELRLLYLSPERMAREDTLIWLKKAPVQWFAIDEAHCISEWGHEFRPDYRQLGQIRDHFPEATIAAFTASATARVRQDIVTQLKLREPLKVAVSFHRSNLRYLALDISRREPFPLLLSVLRQHEGQSVIIYDSTIKGVEETAAALRAHGIRAVVYHGKLEAELRQKNQELWMSNEAPVMVGTLAFGLGINKPSTRAVIHLSLPKSIEQYYQEAGRAGRDGAPADCVLLWRNRDLPVLIHFIEQLSDEGEIRRAWQRYRDVRAYTATEDCRARLLCRHFGEEPKWEQCGQCDVCAGLPSWLTLRPQKAKSPPPGSIELAVRRWRKQQAELKQVRPYQVFSDAVLRELIERRPRDLEALGRIRGIGPRTLDNFGLAILDLLADL
ncbi:MAG: RecQ family ATP-dependent DNA helicase [Acidobacteriota bacterium]